MRDSDNSETNSIQFSEYSSVKNDMEESVVMERQTQTIKKNDNEEVILNDINSSIFSVEQNMEYDKENDNKKQKTIINGNSKIISNDSKNLNKGNIITYINSEPNKINKICVLEDKEKYEYKGYVIYEISKNIDDKKQILCYRRYDNFDLFYDSLKKRYPQYIYPKLPEKNLKTKIIYDKAFLEQRRKQLEFFINEISSHNILGKSEEFNKFLNGNFDDKYFKSLLKLFDYPETMKKVKENKGIYSQGIQTVSKLYNYIMGNKGNNNNERENEKIIIGKIENLDKKIAKYNSILEEAKNIYNSIIKENEEKRFLINNLLFLKNEENNNENNIDKKKFNELIEISQKYDFEKSEIIIKYFEENIIDKLDLCLLYLYGEQKAINRYQSYLQKYKDVIKYEKQENDDKRIDIEQDNAKKDIDIYESKLLEEINKIEYKTNREFEMAIHALIINMKNTSEQFIELFQNSNFIK